MPLFFRRLLRISQMDLEQAAWTVCFLCLSPRKVHRAAHWHKSTKNQWARDDPAFNVIQSVLLILSSIAWGVAFSNDLSFWSILRFMSWSLFVEFLLVGALIATCTWIIASKFLASESGIHRISQQVEWQYAWDVHCNAFFMYFILMHVVQYFLLPLVLGDALWSVLLANVLYAVSYIYYLYITFLGFQVLPFLHNTVLFLYPATIIVIVAVTLTLLRVNLSILTVNLYFDNI